MENQEKELQETTELTPTAEKAIIDELREQLAQSRADLEAERAAHTNDIKELLRQGSPGDKRDAFQKRVDEITQKINKERRFI